MLFKEKKTKMSYSNEVHWFTKYGSSIPLTSSSVSRIFKDTREIKERFKIICAMFKLDYFRR